LIQKKRKKSAKEKGKKERLLADPKNGRRSGQKGPPRRFLIGRCVIVPLQGELKKNIPRPERGGGSALERTPEKENWGGRLARSLGLGSTHHIKSRGIDQVGGHCYRGRVGRRLQAKKKKRNEGASGYQEKDFKYRLEKSDA